MTEIQRYQQAHDSLLQALSIAIYAMQISLDRTGEVLLKDGIDTARKYMAEAEHFVPTYSKFEMPKVQHDVG